MDIFYPWALECILGLSVYKFLTIRCLTPNFSYWSHDGDQPWLQVVVILVRMGLEKEDPELDIRASTQFLLSLNLRNLASKPE